ncbi:MAG: hypothetical protein AAFR44_14335, partial [Pseudomonadota bacterium]
MFEDTRRAIQGAGRLAAILVGGKGRHFKAQARFVALFVMGLVDGWKRHNQRRGTGRTHGRARVNRLSCLVGQGG